VTGSAEGGYDVTLPKEEAARQRQHHDVSSAQPRETLLTAIQKVTWLVCPLYLTRHPQPQPCRPTCQLPGALLTLAPGTRLSKSQYIIFNVRRDVKTQLSSSSYARALHRDATTPPTLINLHNSNGLPPCPGETRAYEATITSLAMDARNANRGRSRYVRMCNPLLL
jgi:hypothetical protein